MTDCLYVGADSIFKCFEVIDKTEDVLAVT